MRRSLVLLAILFFGFVSYFYSLFLPVDPHSPTRQKIIIKKGASINHIAHTLHQHSLIRSPLVFKLVVKFLGLDSKIQAGSFLLSSRQSPQDIARTLTTGRLDQWLTIPEGFRVEQIAELLSQHFSLPSQEFITLAKPYEGQLFPDTYLIPTQTSAQEVLNLLLKNYRSKRQTFLSLLEQSSLTENQVITLASIIERETLTKSEKPIVAGILLKRLEHNWPLQVDATLQYILGQPGNWWPIPTPADRQLSSPYNTYLHQGLPPTPIANPGLASIQAVLQPQPSPYWFYLHDQQGKIHYAQTIDQHQQNIRTYLNQ